MPWYYWVLAGFSAVTIVMTVWYWRRRREPEGRRLKAAVLLAGTGACLMLSFNASGMWQDKEQTAVINLIHIYGLSYTEDGGQLMVATHEGIKWYQDSGWRSGEGDRHDYTGFAPYAGGFYGGGHPAPGMSLPNPLGLVRSSDGGKTVEQLAFQGKIEFNLMAASYRNRELYAYSLEPNPVFKQPGLYRTKDEGKTWEKCALTGFQGQPTAIAAHPDKEGVLALGGRDGLYLSSDYGQTFEKILNDIGISALSFDRDGMLTAGGFKGKPSLMQLDTANRTHREVPLPNLKEDAIAYTAHHPKKPQERIITTFEQDVFLTKDGGETWLQLADNGKTRLEPVLFPKG